MWYPQGEGYRRGNAVVASPMGCVYLDCLGILQNGKFVQVSGGTVRVGKNRSSQKNEQSEQNKNGSQGNVHPRLL